MGDRDLDAKLALRSHFLRRYHADGLARVFDTCQGDGALWAQLRRTYPVASYWGVDTKASSKGRLKIDSARVLAEPGWREDVVDVDTNGAPWRHWTGILRNAPGPTTVFLTIGVQARAQAASLEVVTETLRLPPSTPLEMVAKMAGLAVTHMLALALDRWRIVEAREAPASSRARFVGLRLEPR